PNAAASPGTPPINTEARQARLAALGNGLGVNRGNKDAATSEEFLTLLGCWKNKVHVPLDDPPLKIGEKSRVKEIKVKGVAFEVFYRVWDSRDTTADNKSPERVRRDE
ncbi:unnamed protein product, partial [Amoebophrya sp. A25]